MTTRTPRNIAFGLALMLGTFNWMQIMTAQETGQDRKRQPAIVLPYPEPRFEGKIGRTTADSQSDFPQSVQAPTEAPNVLLIMTDDVGFGASSTFGGPIPTPAFDRLAARGLKYNRFHTTALCSPTRAALLTGRNHHNAHTGIIMERSLGYPGYDSVLPKSCGTVAEVLRQNGYNTAWFGKNHNVPAWQSSAAGPFDLWPTGLGFEYFYGFIGGDVNQWDPTVFENTTPIEPEARLTGKAKENYHLDADLADHAIRWIQDQHAVAPDKPFFVYYVPGATHAPHHAPKDWIARFQGQFDQGWDKVREETFARQKKLGVIPENAELTPRPENLPAWESLQPRERSLYARMMEIYAAFLAYTDHNIGRVIDAVEQTGELDNTLIIYIQGDNGGSAEGTLQGTANEIAVLGNGATETLDYLESIKDELGGPMHYNHFPVPWTWAMNAPMQWTKRYASHFGGIRNGMVMSWPKRFQSGGLREQFHHVIDIVPTILESAGLQAPDVLNGVPQAPIDGISMTYTWDNPQADGRRTTQYFELFGNRGIYHEGWFACTTPLVFAWQPEPGPLSPESFQWELYKLDDDFTQANNLAEEQPEKLAELQELWWVEAGRNNVLPMNFSPQATVEAISERPSLTRGRKRFEYHQGTARIPEGTAPALRNRSYTITATLHVPQGGAEGVVITQGGRFAGWGLVVLDGRPVWSYKRTQQKQDGLRIESSDKLTPGTHTLVLEFDYDGTAGQVGKGGTYILSVDDTQVAEGTIQATVPFLYSIDETLDIGEDRGTPILEDYADRMPFEFNGEIEQVVIQLN
ncbi:MAG: arylsulfatase [Planctomycetota bacterium]|nr:MAG: arylsulfatase [Planctomycetota bacterium]REK18294.1 MAG: arylsulfatase [Planctomycetota bacterium]REK49164.1 MAG: arylsulfatase [Planctomycetota bacterium]